MKKIGLFGGSFDPIHLGHLNLAIALMEAHHLDEVLFCPVSVSPFKKESPPLASKEQRKKMVELAIAPIPQFKLLDLELQNEGLSFTIDTVRALLQQAQDNHEDVQLHLLFAEDALVHFHLWKDYQELLHLAPPLIGSRSKISLLPANEQDPFLLPLVKKGVTPIPVMEISSTEIRQRLHQKKFCGHWLPSLVLDYIQKNQLYS